MKKYLPIVLVAGLLCGNLAVCQTQKQEEVQESVQLNDEFVEHYEFMLNNEQRNEKEKLIIRNGYRGFLLWSSHEFYEIDPEAKANIEEL